MLSPAEVVFSAEKFELVILQDVFFDIREIGIIGSDIKHGVAARNGPRPLKQFLVGLFGLGAFEVGSSTRREEFCAGFLFQL